MKISPAAALGVVLLAGFCGAVGARAQPSSPALPKGRLLFLGIAYDEAPPAGQTLDNFNYAPDNFSRLFAAQSKELFSEIKAETLKGQAANRLAVGQALRALLRVARKNDLVFLYWGTHGGSTQKGWSANLPGGEVFGTEIKAELAQLPCPVVVAISTCGSGGFIRTQPNQSDLPPNVAAFCACRRKQSTNNELDVSLLEALAGFGDADHNGTVTLKEALDYVPMRYHKLLRGAEGADLEPVLGRSDGISPDLALSQVDGSYAAVVVDGVWYGATVLEQRGNQTKVRFLGWDAFNPRGGFAFPDKLVRAEAIDQPGGYPPIEVESEGTWYPATVVSSKGQGFKIHYIGYPDSDDELVMPKRIRFPFQFERLKNGRNKAE